MDFTYCWACGRKYFKFTKNYFSTKWPNDVLAINSPSDGKVCGVLAEAHNNGVVVGIGINVAMQKEQLPVPTATSMALVGLDDLDRNKLLAGILKEFAQLLSRWESGEDLTAEYIGASSTIGRKVEIHQSGGEIQSGVATGVGSHGELILDESRPIYSGDVIHLYT